MGRHLPRQRIGILLVVSSLSMAGCGSYFSEAELASRQAVAAPAQPGAAAIDTSGVPSFTPAAAPAAAVAAPAAAPVAVGQKAVAAKKSGTATAAAAPAAAAVAAPVAPAAAAVPAAVHSGPRSPIVLCSFGNSSGVLGAVSGPAPIGNAAWASWVNAHGGLAGHPVKMINADDGGAAANAQAIAQRCVEQEHAVAIFNEYTFGELDGALPYLKSKGVPVIGSIGAAISSDHSSMVFNPLNGADVGQAWGFVDTIRAQTDKKNLGVLYCQEAATCAQQIDSFSKLLPYQGMHIVYKAQVSLVQPDYTAQLIQAKNAGADVVVLLLDSASVGRVARNAAQQDYHPVLSGTYNLGIQATLDQGPILDGLILASRTPAYSTSPLMADYRDAMARFQPGKAMGDVGAGAFVFGALLAKYADKYLNADNVTSADMLTLLHSVHDEKLGGLLPGVTFPTGDDRTQTNRCIEPVVLSGGRFLQRGGAFVCAPDWKPGA
jgi:branched-chain amino acid transport system substrate-binding protein